MKIKKNITNILLLCLMALSACFFTACDETTEGTNDNYAAGFPTDTLVFEVVPGDTVYVPFNVGYNWRITSDKEWCRVDGDYKSISGKPGKHTVAFVVGEPEDLFSADEALITMRMNNESRVIARIIFIASEKYMVEVSSEDKVYADGDSIVIGTSGQLALNLKSNFNLEHLDYKLPTWLEVHLVESVMTLNVKTDSLKYVFNNDCDSLLLFKDSTCHRSFPVQYVGMDPRVILIEGQSEEPLVVSRDAMRAYVNSIDGERQKMPLEITVTATNDEYQVMSLGYDKANGYTILEDRWFELTDDNHGNITLSVSEVNEGKNRTVTLLAFPKVIADSLSIVGIEGVVDFLYEEVDGETVLKADAKQYLLAQMMQYGSTDITIEPEAQWGLKVSVDGMTYTTSTLSDTLDAPLKATVKTDYGYELLHVNYDLEKGCVIIPESESWLKVTDDNQGNIEIRFDRNTGNMRTAYLLALPTVIAEDQENLEAELFAEGQVDSLLEIRDDAAMFVVAQFIQEAEEESSMKVIDARFGWKYLTVAKETEQKWIDIATGKGVAKNKIFRASLMSGVPFMLNPLLDEEVWNPGTPTRWEACETEENIATYGDSIAIYGDSIAVYGESGTRYIKDEHFVAEPTKMEEEEGDYMLIQFKADYSIEEEFYIIYFIAEDKYLKALVVYNY